MVRLVQPLQRLRRSRLKMHLSLNARVIQHRGRRNQPSPDVSGAFRPWLLLAGAHTLAQPRITEEALITNRAPPTRWHLTISVYSSTSEQPLLHLSYARRCRLHRCPACKGSSISDPSLPSDNLPPGISAYRGPIPLIVRLRASGMWRGTTQHFHWIGTRLLSSDLRPVPLALLSTGPSRRMCGRVVPAGFQSVALCRRPRSTFCSGRPDVSFRRCSSRTHQLLPHVFCRLITGRLLSHCLSTSSRGGLSLTGAFRTASVGL